jgi:hypothetical protein
MRRLAGIVSVVLLVALCGCGGGSDPGMVVEVIPPYVLVTLATRPRVGPGATLDINVDSDGTTVQRSFDVSSLQFPATLTVTAPGRTGDLSISAALDGPDGHEVAGGTAIVQLPAEGHAELTLMLEPVDFVVDARVAPSQFLARDAELSGRQLAIRADGSVMFVWEAECAQASVCEVYARRFEPNGKPGNTGTSPPEDDLAATRFSQLAGEPAVAASSTGFLMTWASATGAGEPFDVRASLFDAAGAFIRNDITISADDLQEGSASPFALTDGSYVMAWTRARIGGTTDVLTRLIRPDGSLGGTITISSNEATDRTHPHGAGLTDGGFVVTWLHSDGASGSTRVLARVYDDEGNPASPELQVSSNSSPTGSAGGVHVAGLPSGGFVVVWQAFDPNDDSLIQRPLLARIFYNAQGMASPEVRVTERTTEQAPAAVPALAVRAQDGAIAVAWADRDAGGDGDGLGVRLRMLRQDGTLCGDELQVNSTTAGDQFEPSLVALSDDAFLVSYTDSSMAAPDQSGNAVRARYVYRDRCD